MKKLFLLFLMAFSSTTISLGAEKIEGAFGMTLGAIFDTEDAIGRTSLTDGTPMYQFSPKKTFRSFASYYVMITPKTHRIYSIWGVGKVENDQVCAKEQALIVKLLEEKYGKTESEMFFSDLLGVKTIDQGNRYIIVKCSGFMNSTIDIRYFDRSLKNLAEEERIELESEKVDPSGL